MSCHQQNEAWVWFGHLDRHFEMFGSIMIECLLAYAEFSMACERYLFGIVGGWEETYHRILEAALWKLLFREWFGAVDHLAIRIRLATFPIQQLLG